MLSLNNGSAAYQEADESEIVKRRLMREMRMAICLEKIAFNFCLMLAALVVAACIVAEIYI